MRFQVLGPLRVWNGTTWCPVRAGQQRVVLAMLLANAGSAVSTEALADEIWGGSPPPGALGTVQGYVFRLRRLIGGGPTGPLRTRDHGYELALAKGDLDAWRFDQLVALGRRELADGRPDTAASQLTEALELWRGPALADVAAGPAVAAEMARLEHARADAQEEHLEALLSCGRDTEVATHARRLVRTHPLRERFWEQLVLALFRCGHRQEALEAYQRARRILLAELGLEPGERLISLQRQVLDGGTAPAGTTVPAQLPPDVPGFTGRGAELGRLDAMLASGDPVVITTVGGTAGIGKTALVLHWAHRNRDRFPDGQLFADLRGFSAGPPLRPIEVLARFLRTLGAAPDTLPVDEAEAAALFRSLVADRHMLVLLDNAHDAAQVRPLLPASPGTQVVITSRDRLIDLVAMDGAVALTLDVLTAAEAHAPLVRLLGTERADAEPAAVTELAQLCGFLPLALRIASAHVIVRPHASIREYVDRLRTDRLGVLQLPESGIRAAFDVSYAALAPRAARLFGLLGLLPGQDATLPAIAALAGLPLRDTESLVDILCRAHLLDEPVPGRYRMHDLVCHYAGELTDPAEARAAMDRLTGHYLRHADAAACRLYPQLLRLPSEVDGVDLPSEQEASAWLDAERANLVATVLHGPQQTAWRLADVLRGYFYLRMHTVDWLVVATAGLAAARADEEPAAQAAAHISLASLHWAQSRFTAAVEHYTEALGHAERAGWIEGQAAALGNLGAVYGNRGELATAAEYHTRALTIDRQVGWLAGQAIRLTNIGILNSALGHLNLAAEQFAEALDLHRQTGSRSGEARTLANLGAVRHTMGQLTDARTTLTDALALQREIGDRNTEADTLQVLALVHRDLDHLDEAHSLATDAVKIATATGDRRVLACALIALGTVHTRLNDPAPALDHHRHALQLARDIGEQFVETDALIALARAHHQAGNPTPATKHATHALTIAERNGYPILAHHARQTLNTIT
jgi:DNA-binding SARP family transcriptional activator/Tfp pilus assembly protein PilF